MNYKETLFFIAKCLTISSEEKKRKELEILLKTETIDWDAVVKVSTAHYVFPALFCNLKKADFLAYLPEELVNFMIHITDLNRERNLKIIQQAKEVNELLLANNITPIFLKGTGNLLENLYDDIGERMVGDIDFIISNSDFKNGIKLLKDFGYEKHDLHETLRPDHRHYPRLKKENSIAVLEVHRELLIKEYADEFNYTVVSKGTLDFDKISVMSYRNQLCLSVLAKQVNDKGFQFKNIALRNAYDVFLLSKKTNIKNAFNGFTKLYNPLNCYLATCYEIFEKINSLTYTETPETTKYIATFNNFLTNETLGKKNQKKTERNLFLKSSFQTMFKSFYDKEHRNWLFKRFTNKEWLQKRLTQIGLKKSKPNA